MTDAVEPVNDLRLESWNGGSGQGFIVVSFSAPTSPEIVGYRVNCSDSSCPEMLLNVNQTSTILPVKRSGGSNHIVNVVAINRCGQESSSVSNTTVIPMLNDDTCPAGFTCISKNVGFTCISKKLIQGE